MKIGLMLLVLSMTTQSDWYGIRLAEMANIDENGVLIRTKTNTEERTTLTRFEYKLNEYRKLSCHSNGVGLFTNYTSNYYHKGSFFLAATFTSFGETPQKGVLQDGDPIGELIEFRTIFDTKKSGLKLYRSIAYTDQIELDSLRIVLAQTDFDTLPFRKNEYASWKKMYQLAKENK